MNFQITRIHDVEEFVDLSPLIESPFSGQILGFLYHSVL